MPEETASPGRIEWLELFFDLVVVAAVAVFSEGLRDHPTAAGLGLFLVAYAAVWFAWINVVMYTDVAAELTRITTVVVSMLLIAIMAAAAPGHDNVHANAFAAAFILVRLFAGRGALRTGRLMRDWPLLEFGGFSIPWIVSLWVPAPAKYWLWAVGLAVDLAMVIVQGSAMADRQLEQMRQRKERRDGRARSAESREATHGRRRDGGRQQRELPELEHVGVDVGHLDARLGQFIIIVIGEAVAALVLAAARIEWTAHFVWTAVAEFALLVMLWLLTFSYGFAAAPGIRLGGLPPRFGLPVHLLSTLGILLLGVGLGEAVVTDASLHGLLLWTTCAGLSVYALGSAIAGLLGGTVRFWLLTCAVPTIVFPLLVAAVATRMDEGMGSPALLWLLAVPVAWQLAYAQRHHELAERGLLPSD